MEQEKLFNTVKTELEAMGCKLSMGEDPDGKYYGELPSGNFQFNDNLEELTEWMIAEFEDEWKATIEAIKGAK